ncbi:MAG: permease [Pseudomonadota bacterium]
MDIFHQFFMGAWGVLVESARYILFGFFIAGLLKAFLPTEFIAKHLGGEVITKAGKHKRSIVGPVFKAALFGVPLPLCSCGVIPAAAGLREQGASKGATTAFLIATPETGVDSMTVTYGLLDPIMTFVRPISAFITSVAAGIAVDIFDKDDTKCADKKSASTSLATSSCCCSEPKPEPKPVSSCCCSESKPEEKPAPVSSCCCSDTKTAPQGAFASQMFTAPANAPAAKPEPVAAPASSCCCSSEKPKVVIPVSSCCCSEPKPEPAPTTSCCCSTPKPAPISSCGCSEPSPAPVSSCGCSSEKPAPQATVMDKFMVGMNFAFGNLIADIGIWLLIGISLASLINIFIPEHMFTDTVTGFTGMVVMMAIGIPMYVCATASTPIAAAFALKGVSPGAALVFLLAGPATNVATITIVAKMLGKRAAVIYVTTIGVMTLLIGVLVNYLYARLGLSVTSWVTGTSHEHHSMVAELAAVVLVALILVQWTKKWRKQNTAASSCCSGK